MLVGLMRAITILGPALSLTTLALASVGCTDVSPNDDNPFGTAPPMTSAQPATDTGDATQTGGSSGGVASSSGDPVSTGAVDSSSGPSLTTTAEDSTTSGGGGDGTQPNTGMWMPCEAPQDCDYAPALCITITDDAMMLLGGFCSDVGCNNPAADCAPSPNGVAVPVCVDVTVNMMADTACALQCTGGIACPVPMQCINVMGFGEICV